VNVVVTILLVGLLITTAGCSSPPRSGTPATGKEHKILTTLAARNRNAVYVALWTLEKNGIPLTENVSFDSSYSEALPKIEAIRQRLQTLPESQLSALDQSLAYHWKIYSPIWGSNDWP
jgi:hypothetical protein